MIFNTGKRARRKHNRMRKQRQTRRMRLETLENRRLLTTFHVDPMHPDASDANPGTADLPMETYLPFVWAYGQTDPNIGRIDLEAGDTLLFHEGEHGAVFTNENTMYGLYLRHIHGTAEQPITIRGLSGAKIDANPPDGRLLASIEFFKSSFVTVEGLEVSGYGRGVLVADSQDIRITSNYFPDVDGLDNDNQSAIEVQTSTNVLVDQNFIVDSYDRLAEDTGGIKTSNSRAMVLFSNRGQVQVVDNVIYNSKKRDANLTGAGIVEKHPGFAELEIRDNVLINAALDGIGVSSSAEVHHNLLIDSAAIHVGNFGSDKISHNDIRIFDNTIVNRIETSVGSVGAFKYSNDNTVHQDSVIGDVEYRNNIAVDSRSYNVDRAMVAIGEYLNDDLYQRMLPGLSIDNNGYFNSLHEEQFNFFVGGHPEGGTFNFQQWNQRGYDVHGIIADPLLNDVYQPANPDFLDKGIYAGIDSRLSLLVLDDDRLINETGAGSSTLVGVTRSGQLADLTLPLEVQLVASSLDDVQFPSTVTIPAGESTAYFAVSGVADSHAEKVEAVRLDPVANGFEFTRGDWIRVSANDAVNPREIVAIELEIVDVHGTPLSQVNVGDTFYLETVARDLRTTANGVFSVYVDAEYDPSLATVSGDVVFSDNYPSGRNAHTSVPGQLDEIGAIAVETPLGPEPRLIFAVPMTAEAVGTLSISSNSADSLPQHETTVFGRDRAVDSSQVQYGSTSILIVASSPMARDDQVFAFNDGAEIIVDVLANDVSGGGANLSIDSLSKVAGGDASIVNGKVQFLPHAETYGVAGFSYQVATSSGVTDTATVVLNLEKRWQNGDLATDVNGDSHTSPIDALQVINFLNEFGSIELDATPAGKISQRNYVDVNSDGKASALDALLVINELNRRDLDQSEPLHDPHAFLDFHIYSSQQDERMLDQIADDLSTLF